MGDALTVSGDGEGRGLTFPGGGEVTPRRRDETAPASVGAASDVSEYSSDTSYEIVLDDAPPSKPILVDPAPVKDVVLKPVIPEHLQTWAGIKSTATRFGKRQWHRFKVHSVRCPWYAVLAVFWSVVGLGKLAWRQLRWWWVAENNQLRNKAIEQNDHKAWHQHHTTVRQTRYSRFRWLAIELVSIAMSVAALWFFAPWWVWFVVGGCLVPPLSRLGHPPDRPIIKTALVTPQFRKLNSDIVLRAYYAAGLGNPDKPEQKIEFGSPMSRDRNDTGSVVLVRTPYGTPFSDVMRAKEKIASGLDVSLTQVYLTSYRQSNRSHWLFVADVDPLSIPAGPTPLLDCKRRDVWRPAPLGLNERGERVAFTLVFQSMLFGSPPRRGKSWTCRLFALYTALDPYVRLSVFDGKGSPDWRMFALVAHTYGFGLLPDKKQGDPVDNLLATLRAAKREILERNVKLSELPTSVCPDGKLTRDIARNKAYGIPVWVLVFDEIQQYLTTGDADTCLEIVQLLVSIIKVGPSVGVIPLSATQRPSGVGSSDKVKKAFTDYRDNHLVRFALKTPGYRFSDLILGEGAASEGFDSSTLPVGDEYLGIGILHGAPVDSCTVRSYKADGEDTEKILRAARKHREAAGTLDGMAAGEEVSTQPRDPVADALDSFAPGETFVSWTRLAERLADQQPERYAKVNGASLSATLLALRLGIESVTGSCNSTDSGKARGVKRASLERALDRRARGESGG